MPNARVAAIHLEPYALGAALKCNSFNLGFAEPYVFGTRLTLGTELFGKQVLSSSYQSYESLTYGGKVSLAAPITDVQSEQPLIPWLITGWAWNQ